MSNQPTTSAAAQPATSPSSSSASPAHGLLLVMTGASGVGKGTLRAKWLAGQDIFYSTSWTTRAPREGEQHGVDYIFASPEDFEVLVQNGGFLEHAEFVGNRYGTPLEPIEQALKRGQDVVLEIEVEGARQVRERMGEQAIMVFIVPPNLEELRRRLFERGTETPEKIEKRLARAQEEMREIGAFDYVVTNDDLERAVGDLHAIQQAERLKRSSGQAHPTPAEAQALARAEHLRQR